MKNGLTLIIILILIQITQQNCIRQSKSLNQLLKRNHQNVLSYLQGALISSKKINYFNEGNYGVCLRDSIYKIMSSGIPYTQCELGQYISILLLQKYLLNTLKILFWDYDFLNKQEVYRISRLVCR
ncbi:unnamed protein product [Paramecium pentaurelia]|uniref:Transmembrane protein n=1 Tax=Paramecium pentaurelia TaxID=43138 RepID=A0A8S1YQZ7_9CILI|nr:unnamed protein product [Paramecium pentaurelia]